MGIPAANKEEPAPDAAAVYVEIAASIRTTDEISFKLLGLVPLVSGAALAGLILRDGGLDAALITLFSLFAAAVTLGLFRWELRNVQECSRLLRCAEALADRTLDDRGVPKTIRERPPPPQGVGKTEAEKLIYGVTIAAWLVLPVAAGAVPFPGAGGNAPVSWSAPHAVAYLSGASLILVGAIASLFARTRLALPTGDVSARSPSRIGEGERASSEGGVTGRREPLASTASQSAR